MSSPLTAVPDNGVREAPPPFICDVCGAHLPDASSYWRCIGSHPDGSLYQAVRPSAGDLVPLVCTCKACRRHDGYDLALASGAPSLRLTGGVNDWHPALHIDAVTGEIDSSATFTDGVAIALAKLDHDQAIHVRAQLSDVVRYLIPCVVEEVLVGDRAECRSGTNLRLRPVA